MSGSIREFFSNGKKLSAVLIATPLSYWWFIHYHKLSWSQGTVLIMCGSAVLGAFIIYFVLDYYGPEVSLNKGVSFVGSILLAYWQVPKLWTRQDIIEPLFALLIAWLLMGKAVGFWTVSSITGFLLFLWTTEKAIEAVGIVLGLLMVGATYMGGLILFILITDRIRKRKDAAKAQTEA